MGALERKRICAEEIGKSALETTLVMRWAQSEMHLVSRWYNAKDVATVPQPRYLTIALEFARGCTFRECPTALAWKALEKDLGVTLPGDYREFVTHFGSGYFGADLYLLNPSAQGAVRLSHAGLEDFRAAYARLLNDLQHGYWRKLYPEKDGLVLVASSTSRVYLFLDLRANSSSIVILDLGLLRRLDYSMGIAEFICRLYECDLDDWANEFRRSLWYTTPKFFTPIVTTTAASRG